MTFTNLQWWFPLRCSGYWRERKHDLITSSKGNQSWVFIGRTDTKAETAILWPPHAKSWLNGKDFDIGRDWGQEEKGTTEDEISGWHHWLDGRDSEWNPGVGDRQGGLASWDSWGCKESDTTEQLYWTDCISDSFVDHDGYSISSEGFLPAVIHIMVIWVKFTHFSPF